jgi:hypothetical protein
VHNHGHVHTNWWLLPLMLLPLLLLLLPWLAHLRRVEACCASLACFITTCTVSVLQPSMAEQ